MNKKYINNKGITLSAMVVTIIVLIILAGISINFVIGDNGIITQASKQKTLQEIAEITERLELKKTDVALESETGSVPIDDYIKEIQNNDKMVHKVTYIDRVDEENAYITVEDKYEYLLEQEENGNLKIIFQGEVKEIAPRIQSLEVSSTTNKIEVKVIARRADKYVFYIKEKDAEEYTKKEESKTGEYIFKDLEQNKEYTIKVEAVNKNGQDEREVNRTTGEMANLTAAEVKYIKSNTNWTNQNVTTKIEINTEKNISDYEVQYTKFAEGEEVTTEKLANATWEEYTTSGIISEQNETIYTRLYDGTNSTSYTSTTVANIDKVNPSISTVLSSSNVTTKGFKLNIGVTDTSSGLSKIEWHYKLSNESTYVSTTDTYTEMNGSTAGTKTAVTKTKAITSLTSGTYNAYAVVYDVAGNSTTSETISITLGTVATASGATASPTTWTKGSVTITLPTTTGYTTEYQTGTLDEDGTWSTYNSSSKPTVTSNTTVYYRYNDGTNAGTYASKSISNIDTVDPTISTALSSSSVTTKGFTLNIGVTDTSSGLGKIVWYYKLSSADTYTSTEDVYTALNGTTAGTKTAVTKTKAITSLTSGTYNVYAVVYDVAGNSTTSETIRITLGTVETASGATASPTTWTNGKVTVTLPTLTGYTTEYQTGTLNEDGTWSTYSSSSKPTVSSNTTVYYRYSDGKNAGIYASKSISNIDTVDPTISTALNSSSVTTRGFTLNIGVTDTSSGLSKIEWYYKLSGASTYINVTDTYTEMNGSTSGTKTAVTKTKSFDSLTNGIYSAYAIVYDVAGNSTQSETISITLGTIATASGATVSPATWTKGSVTVTLPTLTGYTTEYQIGTLDEDGTWSTYNSSSKPTVSSNTTVYYRYNDGKNAGTYASKTVSNIDTELPQIGTLSSSSLSISGFTLNIQVTDTNSGLSKIIWYYKLSTASSYTNTTDTYTAMNGSAAGTTTSITKSKQITSLESDVYSAYALVYDVAGNSTKTSTITITLPKYSVVWTNNTTANRTIDGATASYKNPTIPVGFSAIDTTAAKWNKTTGTSSEWNNGLVIRNATDGNEFVWIPVDGTNVKYEKWCTSGISYENRTDIASTNGLDVADNVQKYGGFWVSRYEAGLPTAITQTTADATIRNVSGKPLSVEGAVPWNFIDWNKSKANAESMYTTDYVQSGLVNGTQWDTIMKWLGNGGYNLENGKTWGNYWESTLTLKGANCAYVSKDDGATWTSALKRTANSAQLIKTGASNQTKAKNIYDLSGNLWEWTDESYSGWRIHRGGNYSYYGSSNPAPNTGYQGATYTASGVGFRVQLYIIEKIETASGATASPATWTNGNVTVTLPTKDGYTTQYQISSTSGTWNTYSSAFTVSNNTTVYYRYSSGTNAGSYASKTISNIDTLAPGATTVTYNGGSSTESWKNNYNIQLSANDTNATATSGKSEISHYEIDWNADGVADTTTTSNFIPWEGYSSCNTRFRAVDNAGNTGAWSETQHIHMDTTAPTHTNWWWGEVTASVARLYIQATDNAGISKVQCPTSTQTGSYNNWYWFDAIWDESANAFICEITPATFGHYGQTYLTHLYIYDDAGNGGYYNQTSVSIPVLHTHTTSCYHSHTSSCYSTPSYGWGNCGWCNHGANYSSSGSTCPSCGKSPCYPSKQLNCNKEGTLICGYP